MNSLELYNAILDTFSQPNYDNNLRYCSIIVDSIIEEINDAPKSILNSSFVFEAIKMVKKEPTSLFTLDVYTLLLGTHKKLLDNCYRIWEDASLQDKGYYLFKRTELHNNEEKYILQIQTLIHFLQNCIGERELDFSNHLNLTVTVEKDSDCTDEMIPKQLINYSEVDERISNQKAKVAQHLDTIQSILSDSLKEILDLKVDFNDLYTLMIGKKLIALYCSIYDNYKYHKSFLQECQEKNYRNLVNNNISYLEEIEDCLDSLGIEIIVSDPGSPYQGKYQEADYTSFNPRSSIVIESITPGFKYGDDVILKERVKVEGDNL